MLCFAEELGILSQLGISSQKRSNAKLDMSLNVFTGIFIS